MFTPRVQFMVEQDGIQRGTHVLETRWSRNGPGHGYNEWVNIHFDKSCGNFREDKRNSEVVTVVTKLRDAVVDDDTERFADIRQKDEI